MRITSLVVALITIAVLPVIGQEGVGQEIKQGAKKTGQTIKDGLETAGEKTKETAKTVGKKTKETAETVGAKAKETASTVHQKSKKALRKAKAETGGQKSTNQAPNTPSPNDR